MKKLLLLSLVALATMITSCSEGLDVNDPNVYCWKISITGPGYDRPETGYEFATSADLQYEVQEGKRYGYTITYEKANFSQCGYYEW